MWSIALFKSGVSNTWPAWGSNAACEQKSFCLLFQYLQENTKLLFSLFQCFESYAAPGSNWVWDPCFKLFKLRRKSWKKWNLGWWGVSSEGVHWIIVKKSCEKMLWKRPKFWQSKTYLPFTHDFFHWHMTVTPKTSNFFFENWGEKIFWMG